MSLLCIAATCATLSLFAYDADVPLYRQSQASVLRSPLDAVDIATFPEPKGFRYGSLRILPYFSNDTTFSDNTRRANSHAVGDVIFDTAEGFSGTFRPMECLDFSFNYDFGEHDYIRGTEPNYLSHAAGLTATLNRVGVEGLSLTFSDQFLETANSGVLENEIAQFSRYQSDRFAVRSQYKYNRFKLSGAYAFSYTNYYAKSNSTSNFRTHTGDLEGAWEWLSGRLELFESFQIQRTLFDQAVQTDFDSYTLQSGVRGTYSKLNYSLGVGYAFVEPLYVPGAKGDASFAASIGYTPNRRLNFQLTASRGFQAGVRTGAALETDLTASARIRLTARGNFTFSYTRNQSDRLSGMTQLSVAYSSRFDYKLMRNASLGAGLTRYERSSTLAFSDFIVDEAKLSFKLAW